MTSNRPPTLTSQSVNNAAVAPTHPITSKHNIISTNQPDKEHLQSTPSKCQTPKNKPNRLSKRLRTPKVHTYLHPPLSPRYSSLTRPSDPNHPAHPEHPKVRHRPIPTCLPPHHQKTIALTRKPSTANGSRTPARNSATLPSSAREPRPVGTPFKGR